MKIGILTYHDEVNYGSLLQAYAMQTALRDLGHSPVIIDRWFQPDQKRIYGILHAHSVKKWYHWLRGVFWGTGVWALFLRQYRSRSFIKRYLHLTPYCFHDCKDAPEDLGVDMITVGSDQVWHPLAQPQVYLLTELKQVPGIAYAASFGTNVIPEDKAELYRNGFKNFKAIGIREREGVEMARRLGAPNAAHVVDPTLLVNPDHWHDFIKPVKPSRKNRIVCYFLTEDYLAIAERLGKWAKKNHVVVDLFLQGFTIYCKKVFPEFQPWLKYWTIQLSYPLNFRYAAGPVEFVSKIAGADCVFTNSFHALMFSTIFRRNVRIVKPTAAIRKGMDARMKEFSGTMILGPLIMETLEDALLSYERGEQISYNTAEIDRRRKESENWLKSAIALATGREK